MELLEGSTAWHSGFLVVALAMQKKAASLITAECQKQKFDSILFTGHSAGGAIAQMFFAMTKTTKSAIANAVSGSSDASNFIDSAADSDPEIPEINCITFGAPPVADSPIPHQEGVHKPGVFLNIINEGDVAGLAQEDYIKSLIEVYVLSTNDLRDRYKGNFRVPPPVLKVSGTCLILRDADPDVVNTNELQASIVDPKVLETKLFGSPCVHFMKVYVERINELMGDFDPMTEVDGVSQRSTFTLFDTDEEVLEDEESEKVRVE